MLSPPRFKIFTGTCIVCVTTARDSGWKMARRSVARPVLTTGHGIRMYSLVPVRVVRQQSWLTNSSWRLARSSDNILFRDASCYLLMTDCGGYAHFSCCYRFLSPYVCTAQYLVKQTLCSSFILIYSSVNSYIVHKAQSLWRLSLQESDITKKETIGLRKLETIGLYHTSLRSLHQENLWVLVGERWGQ